MGECSFASRFRRRSQNRRAGVPPHAKGSVSRPYRAFDPEADRNPGRRFALPWADEFTALQADSRDGAFKQSNHCSREASPPLPPPSRSFVSLAVTDPVFHRKARTLGRKEMGCGDAPRNTRNTRKGTDRFPAENSHVLPPPHRSTFVFVFFVCFVVNHPALRCCACGPWLTPLPERPEDGGALHRPTRPRKVARFFLSVPCLCGSPPIEPSRPLQLLGPLQALVPVRE